jgi:putative acetyltransferase
VEAFRIRSLAVEDGEIAGEIFFDAVHRGAAEHYTPEERLAWAGASPNPSELDGTPAGFMTIDPEGYIDLAFVRSDAAGKGIGWRLYLAIEERAKQLGIVRLTTEASKKAKPFFERQGWTVEHEQVVRKHNVELTNFKMSKQLIYMR